MNTEKPTKGPQLRTNRVCAINAKVKNNRQIAKLYLSEFELDTNKIVVPTCFQF